MPKNRFFWLRHILGIAILHHCAKNKKKLMSQSREKLVTDGRTDGQTNERTNERTKVSLKELRGRSKKFRGCAIAVASKLDVFCF